MTRNWTSLALALAAFFLIVGGIVAQALAAPATLREAVAIERDVIQLSDLFEGVPADRASDIGKAPRAGESQTFDANALARLATRYGIEWRPRDGYEHVIVTRAARTIDSEAIEATVNEAIADRLMSVSFEIEVGGGWPRYVVPKEAVDAPVLIELRHDERSGRFNATFGASRETPPEEQLKIAGRIVRTESVPMPVRAIAPGGRIAESDLEWRSVRVDRLPQDPVLGAEAIVGKAARRPLKPGQMVRAADLVDPIIVAKGAPVTVIYSVPGVQLTMLGRAIEDGAEGQTIRVLNPQSRLVAIGVVARDGTVKVGPTLQTAGIAPTAMQGEDE